MEKTATVALRDCAGRGKPDGVGRLVGELALTGGRVGAKLRDHHHHAERMPVVLKPETWRVWLGEEPADASAVKALLAPLPSDEMTSWAVSPRVGNVRNNDSSL